MLDFEYKLGSCQLISYDAKKACPIAFWNVICVYVSETCRPVKLDQRSFGCHGYRPGTTEVELRSSTLFAVTNVTLRGNTQLWLPTSPSTIFSQVQDSHSESMPQTLSLAFSAKLVSVKFPFTPLNKVGFQVRKNLSITLFLSVGASVVLLRSTTIAVLNFFWRKKSHCIRRFFKNFTIWLLASPRTVKCTKKPLW